MKLIDAVRPAPDLQHPLERRVRDAQARLAAFARSVAEPGSSWLEIALLPDEPTVAPSPGRRGG